MPIDINSLVFSKLTDDSDVSTFSCSDSKDLEDFLRNEEIMEKFPRFDTQSYVIDTALDFMNNKWKP